MSDETYTPTTEEVRMCAESDNPYGALPDGQFDRWLRDHDAQVLKAAADTLNWWGHAAAAAYIQGRAAAIRTTDTEGTIR